MILAEGPQLSKLMKIGPFVLGKEIELVGALALVLSIGGIVVPALIHAFSGPHLLAEVPHNSKVTFFAPNCNLQVRNVDLIVDTMIVNSSEDAHSDVVINIKVLLIFPKESGLASPIRTFEEVWVVSSNNTTDTNDACDSDKVIIDGLEVRRLDEAGAFRIDAQAVHEGKIRYRRSIDESAQTFSLVELQDAIGSMLKAGITRLPVRVDAFSRISGITTGECALELSRPILERLAAGGTWFNVRCN